MDLPLAFLAGFLGSVHCVGMCGPLVLTCSALPGGGRIVGHLVYNAGRVVSYALLGALAGALGGFLSSLRDAGPWIACVAGVFMILSGVLLFPLPIRQNVAVHKPSAFRRAYVRALNGLLSVQSMESRFYVGALSSLLPCGLLYAMVARAAAAGSPIQGGLTMAAFGIGIVPALLLTGTVASSLSAKVKQRAYLLASVTVMLMGLLLIIRAARGVFHAIAIP